MVNCLSYGFSLVSDHFLGQFTLVTLLKVSTFQTKTGFAGATRQLLFDFISPLMEMQVK